MFRKNQEKEARLYKQRLKNIKPAIDNRPPPRFKHLQQNLKKAQLEDERNMDIERENRLLLEKMSSIMESSKGEEAAAGTIEFAPGVRINKQQLPMLDNWKRWEVKSINKEVRRKELMRITEENQAILRRIQEKKPFYTQSEWDETQKSHDIVLRNISEYPPPVPTSPTKGGSPLKRDTAGVYPAPQLRSLPMPLFATTEGGTDGGQAYVVMQLGGGEWGTGTPGANLAEAQHQTLNALAGVKSYSIYPSQTQEKMSMDENILPTDAAPLSLAEVGALGEEQFSQHIEKLVSFAAAYADRIEEAEGAPPDLCVAHMCFSELLALTELNEQREREGRSAIPLAVIAHGDGLQLLDAERKAGPTQQRFVPMVAAALKASKAIFVLDAGSKNLMRSLFPNVPDRRVAQCAYGVNQFVFSPSAPADEALIGASHDALVVYRGGLDKSTDRAKALIIAAAQYEKALEADGKKVVTVIAGAGDSKALQELAAAEGCSGLVFPGPISDGAAAGLFAQADVSVACGFKDARGEAILQCLACGTPVIAPSSGAAANIVSPAVGALVEEVPKVSDENNRVLAEKLAGSVIEMLRADAKGDMSAACEATAGANFTLKSQCSKMLEDAKRLSLK